MRHGYEELCGYCVGMGLCGACVGTVWVFGMGFVICAVHAMYVMRAVPAVPAVPTVPALPELFTGDTGEVWPLRRRSYNKIKPPCLACASYLPPAPSLTSPSVGLRCRSSVHSGVAQTTQSR